MRSISRPLSVMLFDLASLVTGQNPSPEALNWLAQFDRSGIEVQGYTVKDTEAGLLYHLLLPPLPGDELKVDIPGLPGFECVLHSSTAGMPLSLDIVQVRGPEKYLDLRNLRFALRMPEMTLHPLDGKPRAELVFNGTVRFYPNGTVRLVGSPLLSLSECEIGSTGIVVSLEDVQFDLSETESTPGISELGLGIDFRGLFARRAVFGLLPGSVFAGQPGLRIEARDLAIGTSGVTGRVHQVFRLSTLGKQIDPASEVVGSLPGRFQVAVSIVDADIFKNQLIGLFMIGRTRLPFLDSLMDIQFGLDQAANQVIMELSTVEAIDIPLGLGHAQLSAARFSGRYNPAEVDLRGTIQDLRLDIDPLHASVVSTNAQLFSSADRDELRLDLHELDLGPLGNVPSTSFIYQETRRDDVINTDFWLEASFEWSELRSRLSIPTDFPSPPDDGQVHVIISWEQDAAGTTRLKLVIAAELQDVDNLWAFLPANLRPEVRRASLDLTIEYSSPGDFASASQSSAFSGQMNASFEVRFPQLAVLDGSNIINIQTGDPQGWIAASMSARTDAQGQLSLAAQISNPVSVDFNLPGLTQDSPPLHLALTEASIALATGGSGGSSPVSQGEIVMAGNFTIHPLEFPPQLPITTHLKKLFEPLSTSDLGGEAIASLKFKDDRLQLMATCNFEDARLEVELFEMLGNLARGLSTPAGEADSSRAEAALDLKVGFGLHHLAFQFGEVEPDDESDHAQVELGLQFRFGGFSAVGYIRLSDQELAVGIDELLIPLQMPRFPFTTTELDALQTDADWQTELTRLEQQVIELETLLDGNDDPATLRELGRVQSKLALVLGIWSVRQKVTGAVNKTNFQQNVRIFIEAMQAYNGLTNAQSNIQLKVSNVQAIIPFGDPRNLAFEGSAGLIGFDAADPFKVLEEMTLTAGISADMIYFSLDSLGNPIPIPDFGRYTQGSISLSKFSIGYGYTKNSFAAAFQGKITLPPQFIADLNTSRSLGMGVRLPHYSSLAFRLDLIPIPGPIPVIPLFEFNLDLRSPGAPGIASTDTCEPFYDGLELIIPNMIHADFKKLAFSPFLSILPIPNLHFDGDLVIGDKSTGMTIVADNMLFLFGLLYPPGFYPIPFLASPSEPYFDHLCIRLGVAGFGVNFNLERPFPSFNPLALLEVAGLIADPTMPIDPEGALANTVRIALTDAYFFLPRFAHVLFPDAREVNHKELNIEINVGTIISAAQAVLEVIKASLDEISAAGNRFDRSLRHLASQPPDFSLTGLLSALPPEVRKIRLSGSFAGFEASAVILLISPEDAAQEFNRRDQSSPAVTRPQVSMGSQPDAMTIVSWQPYLSLPGGTRASSPLESRSNLFRGIEFETFSEADLVEIPPPLKPQAGVMIGARVKVFGGQRYRFLGALFEDGSFAMISAVDIDPLKLQVAGITPGLPLEFSGRLKLEGRQKRSGYFGSVTASARARWNIIPGIARIEIGERMKPASLALYSDGKFTVKGSGQARLFNGAATIKGTVDISNTHAFVNGEFRYTVPKLVDIALQGSTRFGPGPRFALAGKGTLDILGHRISAVTGVVSETGASIKVHIDTTGNGALQWRVAGQRVNLQMDLAGEFTLRKTSKPEFYLEGRGLLELPDLGGARITGRSFIGGRSIKRDYHLVLGADGSLEYLGRRWLEGYVELGTNGVKLGGRTSFVLQLTPTGLAGTLLANLFFKIDLQLDFILNTLAGVTELCLKGDWLLAARFGTGEKQILPLAASEINPIKLTQQLELELLHVTGFVLVPNGTLKIPVPVIHDFPLKFGMVGTPVPGPAFSYKDNGLRTIPDPLVPPNFILGRNLDSNETYLTVTNYEVSLSPDRSVDIPLDGDFRIFLVWNNNNLRVEIR